MSSNTPIDTINSTTLYGSSANASVGDIALAVGIESLNTYDDKVNQYYKMVHMENIQMQNLNNAMALAQSQTNVSNATSSQQTFKYTDPETGATSDMKLKDFMGAQSIPYPSDPDNKFSKDEWSTVVANIKTASDSLSSTNQVDMMKLQSVLNKENQMSSMTSNIMSKENTASMSIIGNMAR